MPVVAESVGTCVKGPAGGNITVNRRVPKGGKIRVPEPMRMTLSYISGRLGSASLPWLYSNPGRSPSRIVPGVCCGPSQGLN